MVVKRVAKDCIYKKNLRISEVDHIVLFRWLCCFNNTFTLFVFLDVLGQMPSEEATRRAALEI